jgi:hypothetical protein
MTVAHRLRVAWRVLRAEGAAAVRDRTADHLAETVRRRSYAPAPPGWRPEEPIQVLVVSATPPVPWMGGVPTQLRTRLEAEARGRSVALLYPTGGVWRLEVRSGAERWFLQFSGTGASAFIEAVRQATERIGARAIHVDGLAGLPADALLRLTHEGMSLLLTLHDFAALCPQPHRVEKPELRSCPSCPDPAHCESRRAVVADLLAAARAVVFPSGFMRRIHAQLFPGLEGGHWRVLEPPIASTVAWPRQPPGPSPVPLNHVAFLGSVQPHKGSAVFRQARQLAGEGLRWSAYGGGDVDELRELRRLGVRVRGYYRSGSLPALLRRDGVDLALLLSIVPESHSLVLSECVAAGVPVAAFALGALAERVPLLGAGRLVPLEQGAEGIAAVLREMRRDGPPAVPEESARLLIDPVSAAAGHLALYRELGLT